MAVVMIGVDPHKGSHTAVALDTDETKLGQIQVRASTAQVKHLRSWATPWTDRVWAIGGATCGFPKVCAPRLRA